MATHTAQGRAQTFIAASGGRLKDLTLFFESKGPAGNVVAVICETDGGYPDIANSIVEVTITPADIVVGPAGTRKNRVPRNVSFRSVTSITGGIRKTSDRNSGTSTTRSTRRPSRARPRRASIGR